MSWYKKSFGKDYLDLYPHRDEAEAAKDIADLINLVRPDRAAPLLDLGCGAGRHLLALHKLGFRSLYGLDLSEHLLEVAADSLGAAGARHIELIHSDMRHIPIKERFGTVLSLFTSFGYFDDDRENEEVFHAVARALRPDGIFVMDYLNARQVVDTLVPEDVRDLPGRQVRSRRRITPDGSRVEKSITVTPANGTEQVFHESVRLYSAEDMKQMARGAGFAQTDFFGSHDGQPYGSGSRRLILVCRI